MSKTGSILYEKIKNSSGSARIDQINALREYLLDSQDVIADFLLGLKQNQNDIRRIVLDLLLERSSREQHGKTFLIPIIDIVKENLKSCSNSVSAIRTTISALKYLCALLKQDGIDSLTSFEVQEILDVALQCLSCGLSQRTTSISAERRNSSARSFGPESAFVFGAPLRNGFQQTSLKLQKRSSSSSLASIASTNESAITIYDTDTSEISDDELGESNGVEKRRARLAEARKSVRYRGIACISALNERTSRFLLVHWPKILVGTSGSDKTSSLMDIIIRDECLKNRIGAVHTIGAIVSSGAQAGYMAGAEERSRLSAFTSLSGTIASVIVELRSQLLRLMLDKACPLSLLESTIKCTKTLVTATSQVKLKISHSQYLQSATLQLCSHADAKIAVPAYSLLSVLASGKAQTQRFNGSGILDTLQDAKISLETRLGAWKALTASTSSLTVSSKDLPSIIRSALGSDSPLELRQAVAEFILSRLANDVASVDAGIVEELVRDESAVIRAIAADCLALNGGEKSMFALLKDQESTVRAAAIRAIGVKIQQEDKVDIATEQLSILLQDESLLVRMRASWTLGNLCEKSDDYIDLLQKCYLLHKDDEKVSVNAIRGAGAVLSRCPAEVLQQSSQLTKNTLNWLTSSLVNKVPKVRWNSAACIARIVEMRSTSDIVLSMSEGELVQLLARSLLDDKAFKVRLSIAHALLSLVQYEDLVSSQDLKLIQTAVEGAIAKVREEMKEASFKEIQLHALPLQQLLDRIKVHLSSVNVM